MATIISLLDIQGSISGITFYRRRDSDKTFAREKSGPTKQQINTDPGFVLTRKNCTEWDGCSKSSRLVRRVLQPLDSVRDYNMAGPLTGLLKSLQKLDTVSLYGQRSVLFSQHAHLLEGFPMSRKTPFTSIIRTPLDCSLNTETFSARVAVPELVPGVNFMPGTPHPYYRVMASLGILPDLHYTPNGYRPREAPGQHLPVVAHTEWLGVKSGAPSSVLELQLPYTVEFHSFALVLAVAVSFGTLDALGSIKPVKYSGSGYITMVA